MARHVAPWLIAASVAFTGVAGAETPQEKGLRLARAADAHDAGFGNFTVRSVMTLRDGTGTESVRDFRQDVLEVHGDGDKSLIVFHSPPDVKGTALLTHAHVSGDDDQWLLLPALNRVKRISASNRSGSFVGSEFAYEDISSQEVEEFSYAWLRDEACPAPDQTLTCHVIDRFPTYEGSGYIRQQVWMDSKEFRVLRIDYFDRKESHLKTLRAENYERYLDRHWRPARMVMINHQTGKETDLDWSDYKFDAGLDDGDFTKRALERAH